MNEKTMEVFEMNSSLKNLYTTGAALALILTASTACAQKEGAKIDVKTDGTAAQTVAQETQVPDYLDPVREMIQMQREMDRFIGRPFAAFSIRPQLGDARNGPFSMPDMDLTERADAYHVQMDLPGMDKSGITVEVKDNILTVKAERKLETSKKDGDRLLMQERTSGFMSRAIMLAKPVDASKVAAEYADGVLKITLPKVKADQAPQKVEIK